MKFVSKKMLGAGAAVATVAAVLLFSLGGASKTVGLETDVPAGPDVSIAASEDSVALGGFVTVSVTVTDDNGDPLANSECTFSIASQPGDDALVGQAPVLTDGAGNASTTLNVGSTPGTIEVEADCDGTTASVSVVAEAGEDAAEPPASLPDTGNGGYLDEAGSMRIVLVALLAGLGIALAGGGMLAGRLGHAAREDA